MANDPDLALQFSGPYVQTFMTAVSGHIARRIAVMEYFYNLTLQNADSDRLIFLGGVIGFPWPSAPAGTFNDNSFIFGSAASFPTINNLNGFGTFFNPAIGGLLSSALGVIGNFIPISKYQQLLAIAAQIKFNGLTLANIDAICQLFGPKYTINFSAVGDILIVYQTVIGASNIFLCQTIFTWYAVDPQIFVSQG